MAAKTNFVWTLTIAINPNDADAWNNRGSSLGKLGRYTEAVTSFDKALAIKPDLPEAKQNREIVLEKISQA